MFPTRGFQGTKRLAATAQSVAARKSTIQLVSNSTNPPESKSGFYFVLAYLLFEFGRPQDVIPGIKGIPIGSALSVLILFQVLTSGRISFSRLQTRLWIPMLAIMAIHVPIAVNNFWALMTFKDMFLLYCVYLGIITFVNSTERMMTLMKLWMWTHVFLGIMGIFKGGKGIGAWMGDENDFCMVMNMAVPFAYFLIFSTTAIRKKIQYLGFLGAFILAAMASLSRGGFMGLAAVGAYCWYRSPKKMNGLVVLLVAVLFMVLLAPETYWDEIGSSTSDETINKGTGAERLYTWGIGMDMFYANPIIGIGQSNFPWTFEQYQGSQTFQTRSIAGRQAHSAWVTLIAELGLAGVIIISVMLFQCYRDLKSVRTKFAPPELPQKHGTTVRTGEDIRVYLARAMEGSIIGFIVSGVFISILWYPSLWIMMALVVALRNITDGGLVSELSVMHTGRGRRVPPFERTGDRQLRPGPKVL